MLWKLVVNMVSVQQPIAICLPAFYQVSVDWVKAFTNFAPFKFADTRNTRSTELTAEALPFAITSSQPGVCKNYYHTRGSGCPTYKLIKHS